MLCLSFNLIDSALIKHQQLPNECERLSIQWKPTAKKVTTQMQLSTISLRKKC